MSSTEFLRTLRACRTFRPEPVPPEIVSEVLEVARWTGSAKNSQPWELMVVRDRGTLIELSTCGWFAGHLAGAPLAIALLMEGAWEATGYDEGRLAERVMLAAWGLGVGSCIATIFPDNHDRARDLLGVPSTLRVTTVISLGYPTGPIRLPADSPLRGRKPLDELVSWERYGQRVT